MIVFNILFIVILSFLCLYKVAVTTWGLFGTLEESGSFQTFILWEISRENFNILKFSVLAIFFFFWPGNLSNMLLGSWIKQNSSSLHKPVSRYKDNSDQVRIIQTSHLDNYCRSLHTGNFHSLLLTISIRIFKKLNPVTLGSKNFGHFTGLFCTDSEQAAVQS